MLSAFASSSVLTLPMAVAPERAVMSDYRAFGSIVLFNFLTVVCDDSGVRRRCSSLFGLEAVEVEAVFGF